MTDDPDATLFFRAKNIIAGLCGAIERPKITLEKGGVDSVWAHPARQARIVLGGQVIGCIAQVHPSTLAALRVHHGAVVAELDLDALRAATEVPTAYAPLPKFPAVFRDFAVVVASDVSAARVRDAIVGADNELISEVSFQSIYTGEGIAEGEKSLAWSVTLRHVDRTLTEPEIHASEAAVWAALEQIGGRPRA